MNRWNTVPSRSSKCRSSKLVVNQNPDELFSKKLALKKEQVAKDAYFLQLQGILCDFVKEHSCSPLIVSYGIGSIYNSTISQYQYATLMLLKEKVAAQVLIYDPVFTEEEKVRLQKDGLELIGFPSSSFLPDGDHAVLFFMPHCEGTVYSEWLQDLKLSRKFMLYGNRLSSYDCLKDGLKRLTVDDITLDMNFDIRNDVFNDCYLQNLQKRQ